MSGQQRLLDRLTLALDRLRRRASEWERTRPGQTVNAWVEFFLLPNRDRTYFHVAWDAGLTLELILRPEENLDEPTDRAAELLALLAWGAAAERETMRHATEPRTEVWTFYRLRFGDDVTSAAFATRAVLTEAYGSDVADRLTIEVHDP
jgi:hypothetical protein